MGEEAATSVSLKATLEEILDHSWEDAKPFVQKLLEKHLGASATALILPVVDFLKAKAEAKL